MNCIGFFLILDERDRLKDISFKSILLTLTDQIY